MDYGEVAIRYVQISEQEYKYLKDSREDLSVVLDDMKDMADEITSLRDEVIYLRGQIKL